ncbi:LOB domain-containing protein 15-like isoform X3 [Carex rostrata]
MPECPRERHEIELGTKIKRETDVPDCAMSRRQILGSTCSLNTITPCAACKLLRRRCAQECPFSPYFSPHEPQKFAAVHKVFGASNVSKLLLEVPESQRADAANSLVYEANVRLRDPVYGCMGAIAALQQQVQALEAELTAVKTEILKYKFRSVTNSSVLPTTNAASLLSLTGGTNNVLAASGPTITTTAPTASVSIAPASSSSSMYAGAGSASSTDYSSITNENNVSYFS